jgi:LysM repeat protein
MTTSITRCSSSEPRPLVIEKPEKNGEIVATEETVTPKKEIRVKATHPRQYTVKKGDTLWGISNLFLQDPWYWPEIWQKNNQITNPHLIFPGDILTLVYVNGRPQMLVNESQHQAVKQSQGLPVKKLSPRVRSQSLQASIPSIPGDAIRQFLSKPRVVTKEQLEQAPRIFASDEKHLILGFSDRVYIRGDIDKERVRFSTFRPGDALYDPVSNELLGYEAKYSGAVRITAYGDPASGEITKSEREILIGDRLLPEDKSKRANLYFPHIPDREVNAQIISLYDSLFGVAQYQIVVINKGERDGMEVGHLLATYTQGGEVYDDFDPNGKTLVKLPDERSGLIMIFKAFDRVSYALTLESRRVIHKDDFAHTPRF